MIHVNGKESSLCIIHFFLHFKDNNSHQKGILNIREQNILLFIPSNSNSKFMNQIFVSLLSIYQIKFLNPQHRAEHLLVNLFVKFLLFN